MNTAIDEVKRFVTDRKLQEHDFDGEAYIMNIMEEIFEMLGVADNNERFMARNATAMVLAGVQAVKDGLTPSGIHFKEPGENDLIDALCDIEVFSMDANIKLGYDPELALLETAKEVNSREGEFVNGKFQKFKTQEAMAKWYKADYTRAKAQR